MDDATIIERSKNHLHHFRAKLIGIRHCITNDLWKTNLFPSNMFLPSVKWLISSLSLWMFLALSHLGALYISVFLSRLSLKPF